MQTLTVDELTAHPVVLEALADAWEDSHTNDPTHRHEEGGWIYQHASDGGVVTRRARRGDDAAVSLANPPELEGCFLIATFHTHPHPADEGWYTGPSESDVRSARTLGVPCIIRADDGLHTTGPESRRGGLTGPPGFPHP